MIKVYIWDDGGWVWQEDYSTMWDFKGYNYTVLEVPEDTTSEDIDKGMDNYLVTGKMVLDKEVLPAAKVDDLDFLAESDHIKVVRRIASAVIAEVYATEGKGYKAHYQGTAATNKHKTEVDDYVHALNISVKPFGVVE